MATTGSIPITPGSGDNVATFVIDRDSATEHIQAMVLADPDTGAGAGVTDDKNVQALLADLSVALKKVLNGIESPVFIEPTTARVMVTLDAIKVGLVLSTVTTVGTLTTVGTVTNQTNWGGLDIKQIQAFEQESQSWALCVRRGIS